MLLRSTLEPRLGGLGPSGGRGYSAGGGPGLGTGGGELVASFRDGLLVGGYDGAAAVAVLLSAGGVLVGRGRLSPGGVYLGLAGRSPARRGATHRRP